MVGKEFEKRFEEAPAVAALEEMKFPFIPAIIAALSAAPEVIRAFRGKEFRESEMAGVTAKEMEKILPSVMSALLTTLPQLTGYPPWWQGTRYRVEGKAFGDGGAEEIAPEEMQKFFPALLGAVLPAIISAAPGIIGAITGRRKAFGEPEPVTEEEAQKFFPALLGAILPTVLSAAPRIIGALRGRRKALGESEEIDKFFFPLIATAIPALVSCVPEIISAVTGQKKELELAPGISTIGAVPEEQQKFLNFLGPVFERLGPILVDAAGRAVGEALRGRQKGLELPAIPTDGAMIDEQQKFLNFLGPLLQRIVPTVADVAARAVGEALRGSQKGIELPAFPTNGAMTEEQKSIFSAIGRALQWIGPRVADAAVQAVREELRGRGKGMDGLPSMMAGYSAGF